MVKHMAISAHAGQYSELFLSAHGHLPGVGVGTMGAPGAGAPLFL